MRLPDIFLFNPTCEYAVANGNASWQANKLLQKMEADLATLPLFFTDPGDVVLVDRLPSQEFLQSLVPFGIAIPGFVLKNRIAGDEEFISQPKNRLIPWGWSPAAHKLLAPLKPSCVDEFRNSPVFEWNKSQREIYSKKLALGILQRLKAEFPSEHFIADELLTEVCIERSGFEALLRKWGRLMVKAPWSSSGRGLQPITKTPIHPKVWEKLLGIVNDQGYAIVEPFLDKQLDMAFQFKLEKGEVSFIGISNFTADKKGQYVGNNLNGLPGNLDPRLKEFAGFIPKNIIGPLIKILESSELARRYEGYFGVDVLIFRNGSGELKVNPCLEINVRLNMGLLSLFLEKLVHPEKKGIFRTYYKPGTSFLQFKTEMEKKHPLLLSENKIIKGFFALTEAREDTAFGAYLLV